MFDDNKVDGKPCDAIYCDNDGKKYPALIISKKQEEVTIDLGNGKSRIEKYLVARLRVDFGDYSVRNNENGQKVSLLTPKTLSGVALKGSNPNKGNKAYYEPKNPDTAEKDSMEYAGKSREDLIKDRESLLKEIENLKKSSSENNGVSLNYSEMSREDLVEIARRKGIKHKKDVSVEELIELVSKE